MKKLILGIILLLPMTVSGQENWNVTFSECVDGDTANLIYKEEEIKIRMLAVDTPETKHPTKGEEPYGKEASNYTCERLTNASKIELEFDEGSDEKDKYDRYLVWVWVDGELLQEELIEQGYAKVDYLYGDYKYTEMLQEKQEEAVKNTRGMWNEEDKSELEKEQSKEKLKEIAIIAVIIVAVIVAIFNKSVRKKLIGKVTKEVKKEVKKSLK